MTYLTWMIISGGFAALMFAIYCGISIRESAQVLRQIKQQQGDDRR